MESVILESSSEDEDDYLNSVAKLKALKKHASANVCEIIESQEEKPKEEESKAEENIDEQDAFEQVIFEVMQSQAKTTEQPGRRPVTRSSKKKKDTPNQDPDLEIVSVEEKSNVHNTSVDDLLIVEDNIADLSDDENYEMDIKVLWQSQNVHRVTLHRHENFQKVLEYFADLEGVSVDEILLTRKEQTIQKNDTPASINLSVIDILEGGIFKADRTKTKETEDKVDENICMIKIQTTDKKSLKIPIPKDQNFNVLFIKIALELSVDKSKIKLYFDGESVTAKDTPDSLDLEEEACFDLRLSS